jgi:hypothetical protein
VHNSTDTLGPNPYCGPFLALTWASTTCITVVCILIFVDWKFAKEIHDGCSRLSTRQATRDAVPAEEWRSEKTCIDEEK